MLPFDSAQGDLRVMLSEVEALYLFLNTKY